jgi:hypothetical protein
MHRLVDFLFYERHKWRTLKVFHRSICLEQPLYKAQSSLGCFFRSTAAARLPFSGKLAEVFRAAFGGLGTAFLTKHGGSGEFVLAEKAVCEDQR